MMGQSGRLAIAFLLFGWHASCCWAGTTYRWVDDAGSVHYSDQIPPDEAKHRHAKLSAQGRETEVIEGAKTAEQLEKEQQLRNLRAEQDRVLAEQRDRDLALLRTYRNEEEMQADLQNKLSTIDSTIKITDANRQRQAEILASHEKRAAELERSGKQVASFQLELIAATKRQIASYEEKLRNLAEERAGLAARFTKDIVRFRALSAQRQAAGTTTSRFGKGISPEDWKRSDGVIISAITCAQGRVCDRAWELSKTYVREHTRLALVIETEKILQTASPQEERDIGLTVTRISGKNEDILFLDVRCRPSTIGEEFCLSPEVRAIRAGFRAYLEAGLGAARP